MSAACRRCMPLSVDRGHLAAQVLGRLEPWNGCSCLAGCGAPGCTGTRQAVIDKPTRTQAKKERTL